MTEQQIRACFRLGVEVYLRSERTGRVWDIKPCEHDPTTRVRGYPSASGTPQGTGWLTPRQVEWHLQNKPHNFSTTYEQSI
jgi:hypothetical protein